MNLKEKILKEMVLNLDIVREKLAREIYEDIMYMKLKPKFEKMTPGELLNWINTRLGELIGTKGHKGG